MMKDCRHCGTRITTMREKREARKVGYWTIPAVPATWLHLVDGHDDHPPEPPPERRKKTPNQDATPFPDGPTP